MSELQYNLDIRPYPASNAIPDWYKSISPMTKDPNRDSHPEGQQATVKKCYPIKDSLLSGYIIPLTADIYVKKLPDIDGPVLSWRTTYDLVSPWHREVSNHFELPKTQHPQVFKLHAQWRIQTPKGYSCLFTHPYGYPNTPFKTISGIVDTDILTTDINSPFTIANDFEGIIEAGTPMVQIIPFKRDSWEAEFIKGTWEQYQVEINKLKTKYWDFYARFQHQPKKYK